MKQNKYDDKKFFEKYSQMLRSINGLKGAGEWETLKNMFPNFEGKDVLDLGCGFGWHCEYAIQNGAKSIIGVDISKNMLEKAKKITNKKIKYILCPIEDIDFKEETFDIVISSLVFHYIKDIKEIFNKINKWIKKDSYFIFTVEHPVFTSYNQDWIYNQNGEIMYFPIDNYFIEGERNVKFLEEDVLKYHRTLTTYINELIGCGFSIIDIKEPIPPKEMINLDGMKDELRRPMMLIISSKKLN